MYAGTCLLGMKESGGTEQVAADVRLPGDDGGGGFVGRTVVITVPGAGTGLAI